MAALVPLLTEVVAKPELVVESRSDAATLLCYRYLTSTPVGTKWMCVVVKYEEDDAFVLTAYLTEKPKKGNQLWSST